MAIIEAITQENTLAVKHSSLDFTAYKFYQGTWLHLRVTGNTAIYREYGQYTPDTAYDIATYSQGQWDVQRTNNPIVDNWVLKQLSYAASNRLPAYVTFSSHTIHHLDAIKWFQATYKAFNQQDSSTKEQAINTICPIGQYDDKIKYKLLNHYIEKNILSGGELSTIEEWFLPMAGVFSKKKR